MYFPWVGSVISLSERVRAKPEPEPGAAELDDLAALYAAHHDFVWRVLANLGVAPSAVEDAVQDVFLVMHRRRDELEDRGIARGLLFGIARRVALSHRRRARRPERLAALPEAPAAPTPDEELARRQAAAIVETFLHGLDDDRRMIFVLADVEGVPIPEIAQMLGIKLNTAYSRLRLVRQQFHAAVSRHRTPGGDL
jgi:RNA polymerase sigma-70 factor (ECF subfamily)